MREGVSLGPVIKPVGHTPVPPTSHLPVPGPLTCVCVCVGDVCAAFCPGLSSAPKALSRTCMWDLFGERVFADGGG